MIRLGVLVFAACSAAAGAATTELPVSIGAGCDHSDYAASSIHTVVDAKKGKGLYVVHVSKLHLPDDDYVAIHAGDSAAAVKLFGRNSTGAFFTKPVAGSSVTIELIKATSPMTSTSSECVGFEIDSVRFTPEAEAAKVAIGDEESITELARSSSASTSPPRAPEINESLCGEDESQEAVCYANGSVTGGAAMYETSRAVARLVIRKDNNLNAAYCTGFLLGCEGHLLTNQHCVRDWIDALNTGVEFFAEAAQCGVQTCLERAACPGRLRVGSTMLVAVSTPLDYALLKLVPENGVSIASVLADVGGYLQLRGAGAKMDEAIYIPQYPMGYGKRIASTASGRPGRVESLSVDTCGGSDVGYSVDTQEGSSGSPVIATTDNLVVALHHCGGCLNGGIPSTQLITDMTSRGVLPKCAVA